MGSGITTPRDCGSAQNLNDIVDRTSEVSTLHSILRSDRWTSALFKYLEERNKIELVTFYLDIQEMRRTKDEFLLQKAFEIRKRYDPLKHAIQLSYLDRVNLNSCTISEDLKPAENYCLSRLTNELDQFLESREYSLKYETNDYFRESITTVTSTSDKELVEKYKDVLIIDDSAANSKLLSYILEANGHRVRQANHGRVGVHIASLNRFDAIFVDLSMKTMDPYEVIKRIKVDMSTSKTLYYNTPASPRRQQDNPQLGQHSIIIVGLVYSECDLKTVDIDHIIPICTSDEHIITQRSLRRFPVKFSRILSQASSNPIAMKIDDDF